jgi:hypothetical protein
LPEFDFEISALTEHTLNQFFLLEVIYFLLNAHFGSVSC